MSHASGVQKTERKVLAELVSSKDVRENLDYVSVFVSGGFLATFDVPRVCKCIILILTFVFM